MGTVRVTFVPPPGFALINRFPPIQFELAESRERYLDLYDFAPVGYVTLDQSGTILQCNLLAAVMLGRDRCVLLGSDITKFIPPGFRKVWFSGIQRMSNDDGKEQLRTRNDEARCHPFAGAQQQGSEIRLTVTDTGIGIRQEFLPHVFEAFQQADSSSSRQHGGLGLGLAIVRHIVELHGGKVYAASAGVGMVLPLQSGSRS